MLTVLFDTQKTPRLGLIFGCLLGFVLIFITTLGLAAKLNIPISLMSMLGGFVRILGLYFSIVLFRKLFKTQGIGFEQAFIFSTICFFVAIVMVELSIFSLIRYVPSIFNEEFRAEHILPTNDLSNGLKEASVVGVKRYGSLIFMIISILVWGFIIGPIASLFFALFLMNKRSKVRFRRRKRQVVQRKKDASPSIIDIVKNKNEMY